MIDRLMEYATPRQVMWAKWLLRWALAFVYGYVVIELYLAPENFLKFVPDFMQHIIPLNIFLLLFGLFEAALVLWFLSGWHTEYPGIISAMVMFSIIIFNLGYFSVLFRNVAIGVCSIVLAILDWHHHKKQRLAKIGEDLVDKSHA